MTETNHSAQPAVKALREAIEFANQDAQVATIADLRAKNEAREVEIERLREVLADLVSWFPEKPSEPEWRLKAGKYGADDAISAARALSQETSND